MRQFFTIAAIIAVLLLLAYFIGQIVQQYEIKNPKQYYVEHS